MMPIIVMKPPRPRVRPSPERLYLLEPVAQPTAPVGRIALPPPERPPGFWRAVLLLVLLMLGLMLLASAAAGCRRVMPAAQNRQRERAKKRIGSPCRAAVCVAFMTDAQAVLR